MEGAFIAANVSAGITTGLGALGLLAPDRAAAFTSMAPVGPNGRSEIRATYGGLFAALGICLILSQSGPMFFIVGVGWGCRLTFAEAPTPGRLVVEDAVEQPGLCISTKRIARADSGLGYARSVP